MQLRWSLNEDMKVANDTSISKDNWCNYAPSRVANVCVSSPETVHYLWRPIPHSLIVECFDAALRLTRLRGFRPETCDEALEVRDLALLPRELGLLPGALRSTLLLERRIVARVERQGLVLDVHDGLDDAIQKFAVVRDQEQSARINT